MSSRRFVPEDGFVLSKPGSNRLAFPIPLLNLTRKIVVARFQRARSNSRRTWTRRKRAKSRKHLGTLETCPHNLPGRTFHLHWVRFVKTGVESSGFSHSAFESDPKDCGSTFPTCSKQLAPDLDSSKTGQVPKKATPGHVGNVPPQPSGTDFSPPLGSFR